MIPNIFCGYLKSHSFIIPLGVSSFFNSHTTSLLDLCRLPRTGGQMSVANNNRSKVFGKKGALKSIYYKRNENRVKVIFYTILIYDDYRFLLRINLYSNPY